MIDIILTNATPMAPNGFNLGESLKLITSVPDKPISVTAVVDESPVEPSYEKKGEISIHWTWRLLIEY